MSKWPQKLKKMATCLERTSAMQRKLTCCHLGKITELIRNLTANSRTIKSKVEAYSLHGPTKLTFPQRSHRQFIHERNREKRGTWKK